MSRQKIGGIFQKLPDRTLLAVSTNESNFYNPTVLESRHFSQQSYLPIIGKYIFLQKIKKEEARGKEEKKRIGKKTGKQQDAHSQLKKHAT